MPEPLREDWKPRVHVNKSGWRVATISSIVVSLGLVAALLAQDGLWDDNPAATHPDGLTTLALVLAVMAFLIQIFVFVFQSSETRRGVQRAEELDMRTQGVLDKIEASSAATQEVLFAQFDRLLDFIVGNPAASSELAGEQPTEALDDKVGDGDETAASAADVQRIVSEALARQHLSRPTFSPATRTAMTGTDLAVLDYLKSWPSQDEAQNGVQALIKLPPLAVGALTRLAVEEVAQRSDGKPPGLPYPKTLLSIEPLVKRGLARREDGRIVLTHDGHRLARLLPITGRPPRPEWMDEVVRPLATDP